MGLGFSFGKNKQNISGVSAVDKTETGVQTGSTTQSQTQAGTSSTVSNLSGATTESGATKTAGTTAQNAVGSQATSQVTQSFSDAILQALEKSTLNVLGSANSPRGPQVEELNGFNKDQFVQAGTNAAAVRQQGELETSLNGLFDSVGGTASGNSSVALLANRLRGDAASNIAGVNAQLEGQGNDILRNNILAGVQSNQAAQGFAAQLLGALKGGTATTTGAATTAESTTGSTAQTGESQTAGTTQQQQSSTTDTTQTLLSIIDQLINSQNRTVGTETSDVKTKKSGGGIGLSI